MKYKCALIKDDSTERWEGDLEVMRCLPSCCEAGVTGRGSYFHIIVGEHSYGKYVCIPNLNLGSELAALDDVFWNRERLSRLMGEVDATTLSYGIRFLGELLSTNGSTLI